MIQSKIKPIKAFIYMKSGHLFRLSVWSEEKDIRTSIFPDCTGNFFSGESEAVESQDVQNLK
jgi:hypothetical protein